LLFSLLSPDSCPKESKQASVDKTMDASSTKVKLHIANVPYEMKWQELKDLLRDKGAVRRLLCFAVISEFINTV